MVARLLTAALLTLALFAAALPGVEAARVDRTEAGLEADLARLEAAAADLLATDDPVAAAASGARRVVRVRVPGRSLTAAGIDRFDLVCPNRCRATVALRGRSAVTHPLGFRGRTVAGPLRLATPGSHRIRLALVRVEGRVLVSIRSSTRSSGGSST